MAEWWTSDVCAIRLDGRVNRRLLVSRMEAWEWLLLRNETAPSPPEGYVVSFAPFHDCGLDVLPHPFLRGMLHYYDLELQHLNPNGVQHIAAFVPMCEGYLGIEPHFGLWNIHLSHERATTYMWLRLTSSNRGWHRQWFYLKNDPTAPFPSSLAWTIKEPPTTWKYGPTAREKKRLDELLGAIEFLKGHGLRGADMIAAYHERQVLPLTARPLPVFGMTEEADWSGCIMSVKPISVGEALQHLKEALATDEDGYPVLEHPVMRPGKG